MNKIKLIAGALIIGAAIGYFASPNGKTITKERIVYKEKIVRRTVRVIKPDGTIKETINETEDKSGSTNRSKVVINNRKYLIDALYAPFDESGYQIGIGYRVFTNIALKASYVRLNGEGGIMVGVQVDF